MMRAINAKLFGGLPLLLLFTHRVVVDGFTISQPPMPYKWPIVGTLPDFFARGGVDRLSEIYEVSIYQYGFFMFGKSETERKIRKSWNGPLSIGIRILTDGILPM